MAEQRDATADQINQLVLRVRRLEESLERLQWERFYDGIEGRRRRDELFPTDRGEARYVQSSSDGWIVGLVGGQQTSLPSALLVSLEEVQSGRDHAIVSEGVLKGTKFDIKSGNLVASYRRYDQLVASVRIRSAGPVTVDGEEYDREMTLNYRSDGTAMSAGPFAVKTDPTNPIPNGTHDVELPDFPHDLGSQYGSYGTVWFRIGHSGDRYVHPGRISAGCLTCVPTSWEEIYMILHRARGNDAVSVGKLKFA